MKFDLISINFGEFICATFLFLLLLQTLEFESIEGSSKNIFLFFCYLCNCCCIWKIAKICTSTCELFGQCCLNTCRSYSFLCFYSLQHELHTTNKYNKMGEEKKQAQIINNNKFLNFIIIVVFTIVEVVVLTYLQWFLWFVWVWMCEWNTEHIYIFFEKGNLVSCLFLQWKYVKKVSLIINSFLS